MGIGADIPTQAELEWGTCPAKMGHQPNATTTTQTVYYYNLLYAPNSNVVGYDDEIMGTWAFTYDTLNRLATATEGTGPQPPAGIPNAAQGLFTDYCWSYDAWGNRTQQLGASTAFPSTAGGPSICNASQPQFVYNAQNRMTNSPTGAPVYDAAGDITTGTSGNQYLYDAEGRICAVATAGMDGMGPSMTGYVYDAAGNRVAKGPITKWSCDPTQNGFESSGEESDYIHNQSGRPVTKLTMDEGVMTWNYTNVYANGQLFATYDAQGLHFDLDDWLGTRRVTTDYAGVVEQTCASLPYGDQLNCTGSQDAPNEQHFTGKTHDTESGLDYFGARYYSENDARFMSPDPLGGHLEDPQSLNKYMYARDNPLTLTDSTGLDFALDCSKNNGTNCQGGHQYYRDKKGWHETVIRSDKHGNLTDQQGNKYSGSFNGKTVTFNGANGNTSTGEWIQGSHSTSGITGGGPLSNKFNFTFYNHGTHQQLNFTFNYSGSMTQAFGELQHAGFTHWNVGDDIGFAEWRTDVPGRNSSHFLVWDPNWLERVTMSPPATLPQGPGTRGEGHVGEYYPGIHHTVCDVMGFC